MRIYTFFYKGVPLFDSIFLICWLAVVFASAYQYIIFPKELRVNKYDIYFSEK